jgi:phage head maturation protease
MLKKSASFVLGSSKSSTYPRGYASGFDSPAALLDGLFEHSVRCSAFVQEIHANEIPLI